MANIRTDKKGRKLNTGEYQASDGRYIFHYEDSSGKKCKAYSWCLTSTDKPPKGKKCDKCLRVIEAEIAYNKAHQIETAKAKKYTVDDLFIARLEQSKIKRESTLNNYRYMYEKYIQPIFGSQKVNDITHTMIFNFYENELFKKRGFNPGTVGNVNTIFAPIFKIAVIERVIPANPCVTAWELFSAKHSEKLKRRKTTKHSFTKSQQECFMEFVRANKVKYDRWYNLLIVFLGTGCRVGELLGLTWGDIDLKENIITINHQLQYRPDENGKSKKTIAPPKSDAGNREIPLFSSVKTALLNEKQRQMKEGVYCQDVIDGYIEDDDKERIDVSLSDFVFLNRYGNVQLPHNTNKAFERIRLDYNAFETELAQREHREPELMPHFSNHILRHTFCTRYCENETNVGVIKDTMGHGDIKTTMNFYNEVQRDIKKKSFANLEGVMLIG